jgi:hypothetical protein
MNTSKTNHEGRDDYGVALRHRDPRICSVGATAIHLLCRFHCSDEAFPDIISPIQSTNWFEILLVPSRLDNKKLISPSSYNAENQKIFQVRY